MSVATHVPPAHVDDIRIDLAIALTGDEYNYVFGAYRERCEAAHQLGVELSLQDFVRQALIEASAR